VRYQRTLCWLAGMEVSLSTFLPFCLKHRSMKRQRQPLFTYHANTHTIQGTYNPEQWKTRKYLTGHFRDSPFVEYYDNITTGRRGQSRKTTLGDLS